MIIYNSLGIKKSIFIISFCLIITGCACKPGTPPENNSLFIELDVNEEKEISISAINPWNWAIKEKEKGIILNKTHTYQLKVDKVKEWIDADIDSDPEEGWKSWKRIPFAFVFWKRRCPSEPWYALIGAVHDNSGNWHCFKIGNGIKDYRPETSGRLYIFANDIDMNCFYKNNHGSLRLTIIRLD